MGDAERRDALLRRSALAAYLLCAALTVGAVISAEGLDHQPLLQKPFHLDVGYLVTGNVYALSGLLVAWARPRHPIGWLLLASAVLGEACTAGQTYGARALVMPGSDLPLGTWALSLSAPLWIPSLIIPATSMLVRYPDGDRPVGWARRFDRMATAGLVAIVVGYAGSDNSVTDEVRNHLPPLRIPDLPAVVLLAGGAFLMLGGALGIVVHTVRRMLRATAPQRQQIVLLFTTSVVAVLLVWWGPSENVGVRAFALVPVAVAIGVLRYGLFGIGEWVRRTLLYGTLTAGVVGVFVAVTAIVAQVVPSGPAPEVLAASVVAVGLMPARERLQRAVDRLVYGDRTDLWSAVQRINAPMARGDGTLLPGVLEAIAQAVRSPGAAVRRRDGEVMASYGLVPPTAAPIVLRVADRDLGELLVAPRSGETGFAGADRRLLSTIAPMLAVVVHAVALAEDLERERQRVVDATQAERGRLRQDLHDGLGPSLTGVGLGLEALETRLAGAHDRDQAMVARLRSEVAGAIEEVRRIIDDLRPTALDGADLVSALRARAAALNQSGLQVEVVVPQGMPSLDSDVEATVYRVVDEALNNVVRHAQATRCRVVLAATDALRVEVQDDGIGLPDNRGRRGVGLDSMRTRAERLGGTFTAARRGVGTSVVLEVPLVPA